MKSSFISLLISGCLQLYGQESTTPYPSDSADSTLPAEAPAKPTGGIKAFYRAIGEIMQYPDEARKKRIQGKVLLEFIVERDGTLSNINVLHGIGYGCDEEAVRALQLASQRVKWTPCYERAKPVRSKFNLGIVFKD